MQKQCRTNLQPLQSQCRKEPLALCSSLYNEEGIEPNQREMSFQHCNKYQPFHCRVHHKCICLYQNISHHMMAGLEIQNSKKFFLINIIQGNLLKISCLPRQRGGSRGVDAWKQLKVEETHFHLTPTGSSNLSNASKQL